MLEIIIISILTLVVAFGTHQFVAKGYRSSTMLLISLLYIPLGSYLGLSTEAMGIEFNFNLYSILVLMLSLVVSVITLLIASKISLVSNLYSNQISKHSDDRKLAVQIPRIVFLTSLPEEIIFRGVLFGLLYGNYSLLLTILFSSFIFYLWHIPEYVGKKRKASYQTIMTNTLPTFFAGLVFNGLRIISGGIFLGWILHSALNISGLIFAKYMNQSKS